jgi:peroxiredoxin
MAGIPMHKILLITLATILLVVPVSSHAVIRKGVKLPAFSATTAAGIKISSTEFSGKVLLLAVSSDYCSYCKTAIPYLNRLNDQHGKAGMLVQGLISGSGFGKEALRKYIDNNGVYFPMAFTSSQSIFETIGAYSVPTFILIDKKNNVAGYFRGFSDSNMKQIENQAVKLLAE